MSYKTQQMIGFTAALLLFLGGLCFYPNGPLHRIPLIWRIGLSSISFVCLGFYFWRMLGARGGADEKKPVPKKKKKSHLRLVSHDKQ